MSIETENDWKGLWRVGRLVRRVLEVLESKARPGMTTGQLDDLATAIFDEHGARSAPMFTYGFPRTVLLSVNDEIVHGIPGARELRNGDLLKIDVTAEMDGYIADAARTVVVGAGSETAQRLRTCARAAFERALRAARVGNAVNEIGRAVEAEVRGHGFWVVPGLDGHGTGRKIHEPPAVPNRYNRHQRDRLTEGLVLTIEPIISAGPAEPVDCDDGWTIRTSDGSLAAHYEHTIVITKDRPILLTAA